MLGLRIPFKQQQYEAREEAILDATNQLLSRKGFDLMTMDDVADAVGIAKGSLYKHFTSKEKLAAATMVRLLTQTIEQLDAMPADWKAIDRLEAVLRWSLQHRLKGGVPHLPSTRGAFQRSLLLNLDYVAAAMKVNKRVHALVAEAKRAGDIDAAMPDDVVVFTIYARSCDPTIDFLRQAKSLDDAEIVDAMVDATFRGLAGLRRKRGAPAANEDRSAQPDPAALRESAA
ncbi:MAG TPA: helix-turn-helix domain-containing protein [Usitatibacteraceae bacterium]|nr:helix-turn-helix domain-containing protein [Usitatibacteraceae bacterium]